MNCRAGRRLELIGRACRVCCVNGVVLSDDFFSFCGLAGEEMRGAMVAR